MRESFAESQIPSSGRVDVPYADQREITRGMMKHVPEKLVAQVTGAGGAGGSLLLVPFEPALIIVHRAHAATPILMKTIRGGGLTAAVHINMLDGTVNATPPVVTQVAANNWTIALPTALAPDAVIVVVEVDGVRQAAPGL